MIRLVVAPEGVQLRFLVYKGPRLLCAFALEREAQAYIIQRRKAEKKTAQPF